MAVSNTKESGLESLLVNWLVNHNGYEQGHSHDFNTEYALDTTRLFRFLKNTQPDAVKKLQLETNPQKTAQFLARVRDEITKRGIVDVLRKGIKAYPASLIMFYMTPSVNNPAAAALYAKNIFSVTRQLHFSPDATKLSLDLCIFVNGLPVITFELKNQLTKQNVDDAVYQYQHDRNPKELLFQFTRCMVHFAVDDAQVKFCTRLQGKESWFLPFNKGYKDSAGNPPNPDGLMTDYLWKQILTKDMLSRIIENYATLVEEKDEETGKTRYKQIFPRYHQLTAVESLLADVKKNGVGNRYLIQHSAGSGKSNSIAWLAHQLTGLEDAQGNLLVDSVIVVTDRVVLDKQIRDTIRQFAQTRNIIAWAEHSGDLRKAIEDGRRIIITTIEKFPYVLPEIGEDHKDRHFAIIIDEAHSSQNGKTAGTMNMTLSAIMSDPDMDNEDKINAMCEGKKLLTNASYFAFTATPKNKTLETFGTAYEDAGVIKHRPFHVYTMKQAIQEGFILDVLKYYTPIDSYYRLKKTVEDDPMFDKKKAQKKLRAFVENQTFTIAQKADMMVSHIMDHHGCKVIDFVGGPKDEFHDSIERYFVKAMKKRGYDIPKERIHHGIDWVYDFSGIAGEIISNGMPEAIMCCSDLTAVQLIESLSNRGVNIPDDVLITGFNQKEPYGANYLNITSALRDPVTLAKNAAHYIIAKVTGGVYQAHSDDNCAQFRVGMTCGCCPPQPRRAVPCLRC